MSYDVSRTKIDELWSGSDRSGETSREARMSTSLAFSDDPTDLDSATPIAVALSTPIDSTRRPDLSALVTASEAVGRVLRPGAGVACESKADPGVTADD